MSNNRTFLTYVDELYDRELAGNPSNDICFDKKSREVEFTGSNQASIRIHKNYNGSGKNHFGGASEWGHITVEIALPVEISETEGKVLLKDLAQLLKEHNYIKKK